MKDKTFLCILEGYNIPKHYLSRNGNAHNCDLKGNNQEKFLLTKKEALATLKIGREQRWGKYKIYLQVV
jgi:hypothetical protein